MQRVGIRELKNHLSEYLRLVAGGESIVVTDHGRPVAEIRRPSLTLAGFEGLDVKPSFWEKVSRGELRFAQKPGQPGFCDVPPPLDLAPGTAQRLLDELRGE